MIRPNFMSTHRPVMCHEVISMLRPQPGELHVDGTFGCGGYTYALLQCSDVKVVAIDRDPEAILRGKWFEETYTDRFKIIEGTFGQLDELLRHNDIASVDGVVVDLGVSSPQFDQAERGFSFREDGPLDMRMSKEGESVADWLKYVTERELADVIFQYGEERQARSIARAIVRRREEDPFVRTRDLAEVIRQVVGPQKGIDAATKTFMALRIFINDELNELRKVLQAAEKVIKPGGRLVVVTFHSLEDRIVKEFLKTPAQSKSRYLPSNAPEEPQVWELMTTKPLTPSEQEVHANPRARSAKLRAAVRRAGTARRHACA